VLRRTFGSCGRVPPRSWRSGAAQLSVVGCASALVRRALVRRCASHHSVDRSQGKPCDRPPDRPSNQGLGAATVVPGARIDAPDASRLRATAVPAGSLRPSSECLAPALLVEAAGDGCASTAPVAARERWRHDREHGSGPGHARRHLTIKMWPRLQTLRFQFTRSGWICGCPATFPRERGNVSAETRRARTSPTERVVHRDVSAETSWLTLRRICDW
jgi:hypothetical protein